MKREDGFWLFDFLSYLSYLKFLLLRHDLHFWFCEHDLRLLFLTTAGLLYWQLQTILLNVIQSNQNLMWVKTIGRKLNESLHLLPTCHSDVNIFQMYFSPLQFLSLSLHTAHTWLYIWALNLPQPWRGELSCAEWCFSLNCTGSLSPACRASLYPGHQEWFQQRQCVAI